MGNLRRSVPVLRFPARAGRFLAVMALHICQVVISGVDQSFFEDFERHRDSYLRRFAEKYCFYLYGFENVHGARSDFTVINNTPVRMSMDGVSLNEMGPGQNDILAVLEAASKFDVPFWSTKIRLSHDQIETTAQVSFEWFLFLLP